MNRTPTYVSILFRDCLRIEKASRKIKETIEHAGFACSAEGVRTFTVAIDPPGPVPENRRLAELLRFLNGLGVAFGEDHKHPMAPADFMRLLQSEGILKQSFNRIGWWAAPDGYVVEEVPPPATGDAGQ